MGEGFVTMSFQPFGAGVRARLPALRDLDFFPALSG